MPIIIQCPSCSRRLRVPDNLLGTRVKCPTCECAFDAAAVPESPPPPPAAEASPPPPPASESRPWASSYAATPRSQSEDTPRRCPHCAADLPPEARHCGQCGMRLETPQEEAEESRPWEGPDGLGVRRDCEPHRGPLVLTLGILSIVVGGIFILSPVALVVGIFAWVLGYRDLQKIRSRVMDPQGRSLTMAGFICGIVGTTISGLLSLICVGWFSLIIAAIVSSSSKSSSPPPAATPPPRRQSDLQVVPPQLRLRGWAGTGVDALGTL